MSLKGKLEDALVLFVKTTPGLPSNLKFYRGAEFEKHEVPCVLCWVRGGPESPEFSNNRTMAVSVVIKTCGVRNRKADGSDLTPTNTINEITDLVFDWIKQGPDWQPGQDLLADFGARLTAVAHANDIVGFYAYDPVVDTGFDPDLADVSFVESLNLSITCAPRNLLVAA